MQAQSISILGATGSIGRSTLAILADHPEWRLEAVTANTNAEALAEIARNHGAPFAAIADPAQYGALRTALSGTGIVAAAGPQAVCEAAARPADILVAGIVGIAGLAPTLAAVDRGARIALANKECLVCAGAAFMAEAHAKGATILPVDSEHNGLFQCLAGHHSEDIARLTLTASGGPFRETPHAHLASVTPQQAVRHPNWSMGAKISVDSATLMNKGLEIIEAAHLFAFDIDRIDAVIHPQSIVHGLVAFRDGSMLAHMAPPDMRIPIGHALGWPDHRLDWPKPLDITRLGALTFSEPDLDRFPALELARTAFTMGNGACCALNAANEVAVHAFLVEQLGFLDIPAVVSGVLDWYAGQPDWPIASADDAYALDKEARFIAGELTSRPTVATFAV